MSKILHNFYAVFVHCRIVGLLQRPHKTSAGIGIEVRLLAGGKLRLTQFGASFTTATSTATVTGGVNTTIMVGHNHAANMTSFRIGSAIMEEVAHTFNATTAAASSALYIGARTASSQPVTNLTRGMT